MIESVQFKNFRVLRDAILPLGRFTLIIGPNGSGKSTALQALQAVKNFTQVNFHQIITAGDQQRDSTSEVQIVLKWDAPSQGAMTTAHWFHDGRCHRQHYMGSGTPPLTKEDFPTLDRKLSGIRVYSFDAGAISAPVEIKPNLELQYDGAGLTGVLDWLKDRAPERFEALNEELGQWLPDFDRILFDVPVVGHKALRLRTREGHHEIPAKDLSQGTLLALAMLTLAYLPDPPTMICLEEPDRGIHPRLFRHIQDALYRLSYPESCGEQRDPVQVVATTHSPYMLDLYRDHPEEIVIANRVGSNVSFERLSDRPDIEELLQDVNLGDLWYTGILGGVPSEV